MALHISFHPRQSLVTEVKTFDGFVAFDVRCGTDEVTLFVKDMADAITLLDAATALVSQVAALNAANAKADTITL